MKSWIIALIITGGLLVVLLTLPTYLYFVSLNWTLGKLQANKVFMRKEGFYGEEEKNVDSR